MRKFIPRSLLNLYHWRTAIAAKIFYRDPSRALVVIGVTGTNGKSTTVNLIARILEEAGYKVGLVSTVNIKIGSEERLNTLKMTMPGRFYLQRILRKMVEAGCEFAVIETSSEGIAQYRHLGINYDAAVFTNLTAEHLAAHGGFENYKKAKLELFGKLALDQRKVLGGKAVPKIIMANADDRHAKEFLDFPADKKVTYSVANPSDFQAKNIKIEPTGINFEIRDSRFVIRLLGEFDVYNCLAAIAATSAFGINLETAKRALEKVSGIPGRMEKIETGQNFTALVDYAPEPTGLSYLYKTVKKWPHERIVHVLGSTGGGRDKSRRPILGYIAGTNADVVVVTNEDPYDDKPQEIIDDVAEGAERAGKVASQNLFKILDRRAAIAFALQSAKANDLVLVTGKGAEQAMVVARGRKIPWDDRKVIRELLRELQYNSNQRINTNATNS